MIESTRSAAILSTRFPDRMSQTTDRQTTPQPSAETDAPSDRARALVVGAYDLHVHIGRTSRRGGSTTCRSRTVARRSVSPASRSSRTTRPPPSVRRSSPGGAGRTGARDADAQPGRRGHERARGRDRRPRGRAHRLDADGRLAGRDGRPLDRSPGTRCPNGRGSSTSCAGSDSASTGPRDGRRGTGVARDARCPARDRAATASCSRRRISRATTPSRSSTRRSTKAWSTSSSRTPSSRASASRSRTRSRSPSAAA